mmetsp:Transcript_90124/g.197397  ORF Transcript_90124/g.197397 Transcript_90124/m.197397 type:complete len:556 (+) Transcript_90124:200-1867(+)|eukprot:CAMPEP_0206498320 /NCGR_PEP_ID=MMETSP0324_2-20121206/50899_1 /ASSEMBLY_ACC=CAM_ASM_000836 /TAXON_ID=2866 /ORGANISM="Crypthecodinium cohnii, Strain Seligo" /LENGTH=555 /DNA_ID=CAMNT_0053984435 /DNA_START=193 /DNA_END=1860 /DNA_ORIENTATION=-
MTISAASPLGSPVASSSAPQLPLLSPSASAPLFPKPPASQESGGGGSSFARRSQSPAGAGQPSPTALAARATYTSGFPKAATFHVPWKQLHVRVPAGTRTLAQRLADRQRDSQREWEETLELKGGSLNRSMSLSASSAFAKFSAGAAAKLELLEQARREFVPAPLDDAETAQTSKRVATAAGSAAKLGAKVYKPTARSSLTITKGCRLAQLIESGCIGLVRSSYFEDCELHDRPFSMRQLIPNSFMWRGPEAVNLWWKHGKCFLMVVSYTWLSRDHPDPNQTHLRKLVRILEEYKKVWELHEVAVILDYCSLWQPGARMDTRTAEQKEQFDYGLRELNVAYAHKAITAVKLTEVPASEPRKYEDRGWTLLEEILIDSKGGDWNRWTFGDLDPESTQWADSVVFFMQARSLRLRPPLTPQRFVQELESRRQRARLKDYPLFSNEKDNEEVPKLYEDIYSQLIHSSKLAYENADWSDEEVVLLVEVIARCDRLEKLVLNNNRISLQGASEIAKLIPSLPTLKLLALSGNPLCRDPQATDLLRLVWMREKKPMRNLML